MKTILLSITLLLTAFSATSQIDSVKLSTRVANSIYAELRDCDLAKVQLSIYQRTDSLRRLEVKTQREKIDILKSQVKRQKSWWRRKEIWALSGLLTGILITK